MNARFDPLTARLPRTLAEMDRDPYAWWTNAEAAAAKEEFHRESFDADERFRQSRSERMAGKVVYFLGLCAFVALVLSFCKRG